MNEALLVEAIRGKRKVTRKSRSVLATALCFCLLGMSQTTFSQVPIAKQIDSTNQTVLKPSTSSEEHQASAIPPLHIGKPNPYTANQIREMLLKVAALKDVSKDGAEILEIFRLPSSKPLLVGSGKLLPGSTGYYLKFNKDWYFDMFFSRDIETQFSQFFFGWGEDPNEKTVQISPSPPTNLCIEPQPFLEGIEGAGWQLKYKTDTNDLPIIFQYRRDNSQTLAVFFSHQELCLLKIRISWNVNFF